MATRPQPPRRRRPDPRVEEESRGTYGKRRFVQSAMVMPPAADYDSDQDVEVELDINEYQLSELQETQKQLTALRRVHDQLRAYASDKEDQLARINQEMSQLDRVVGHKHSDSARYERRLTELQSRLGNTEVKLGEAAQSTDIFQHMIHRLNAELFAAKKDVIALNTQLEQAEAEQSASALALQQAKQDQRNVEHALRQFQQKLAYKRRRQEVKLNSLSKMIQDREMHIQRKEDRNRKRDAIVARAKGNLGEDDEQRLARAYRVRTDYYDVLVARIAKLETGVAELEANLTQLKNVTGLDDVADIVEKFVTREETHKQLEDAAEEARVRIEELKEERASMAFRLTNMANAASATSNRGVYQEVDKFDDELGSARKQCSDIKLRSTRVDLVLEECRAAVAKFVAKLAAASHAEAVDPPAAQPPTNEELPGVLTAVDAQLGSMLKVVASNIEASERAISRAASPTASVASGPSTAAAVPDDATDDDVKQEPSAASQQPAAFAVLAAPKVSDMLFNNTMTVEPDVSPRNLRVASRMSSDEDERARHCSVLMPPSPTFEGSAAAAGGGGGGPAGGDDEFGDFGEDDDGAADDIFDPSVDPTLDRDMIKKLSDLILSRPDNRARLTQKAVAGVPQPSITLPTRAGGMSFAQHTASEDELHAS